MIQGTNLILPISSPLIDDGASDIPLYNAHLASLPSPVKWFSIPWLFSECYMYRRLHINFSTSQHWKAHDVFARQKISTFRSSRSAVLELASRYRTLITEFESSNNSNNATTSSKTPQELEEAERLLFVEMAEICLWGNATDLSILTSLTLEDIKNLQGSEARKRSEKNILVNDLAAAYAALKKSALTQSSSPSANSKSRTISLILDNAGFELFVDLLLAGFLLAANLTDSVILHPKSIPWFVSDVTPSDFSALLNALASPQAFFTARTEDDDAAGLPSPPPLSEAEISDVDFLFEHWSSLHAEGKIILRPSTFWTEGGSYWGLHSSRTAPGLFEDMRESELVVFKGELN